MPRPDPPLPHVRTLEDALRVGLTRQQVSRRVRTDRWLRLRPGVYCTTPDWAEADLRTRHVLAATAALRTTPAAYVLSHASAAVLHGLPLPFGGTPVWMTRRPPAPTRYPAELRLLVAGLGDGDLSTRWSGRLTSLDRTVADCLRHLEAGDAVAVGDAALRTHPGLDVAAALERMAQWPYAERGRDLLPLLDGRRESALESASAVAMHRGGVPAPELQVEVHDERGLIGRADFLWPELGVVGEADGASKYDGPDSLVREKRREDRLRRTDLHVVRWGWGELLASGWTTWLMGELRRGRPERFTGRLSFTRPGRLRTPR